MGSLGEAGGAGIGPWVDAFIGFADTLVDDYDVVELAQQLIDRSMALLPIAAAGLLLADDHNTLSVLAASSENARLLELLQLDSGAGPCLLAYRSGEQVIVEDLRREATRWPAFARRAAEYGFQSVSALPLRLRTHRLGSLNLFCRPGEALSASEVAAGQAMADMAVIGILNHEVLARAELVNAQLQTALNSRVVIEQAKGILAERGNANMDRAFAALRSHARSTNQHLADVAREVVAGADTVAILSRLPPKGQE